MFDVNRFVSARNTRNTTYTFFIGRREPSHAPQTILSYRVRKGRRTCNFSQEGSERRLLDTTHFGVRVWKEQNRTFHRKESKFFTRHKPSIHSHRVEGTGVSRHSDVPTVLELAVVEGFAADQSSKRKNHRGASTPDRGLRQSWESTVARPEGVTARLRNPLWPSSWC